MPRPLRITEPGYYFHVMARGVNRNEIFRSGSDYDFYLRLLNKHRRHYGLDLLVFCLMPNHIHLLLYTLAAGLSELVQRVHGIYAQVFNKRNNRVGHLFQDRFKTKIVGSVQYLAEVSRYIHMNPVKAGLAARPEDYPWSSFAEYMSLRPASLVDTQPLLSLYDRTQATAQLRAFTLERQGVESGEDGWPAASGWYYDVSEEAECIPFIPPPLEGQALAPEIVLQKAAANSRCTLADICGGNKSRRVSAARWAALAVLKEETCLTHAQLAGYLGMKSELVVSTTLQKTRRRETVDPVFRALITQLRQALKQI